MYEKDMLETPVLLIIFNRPDTTRKVLDAIRQVQPKKLYVAADGPRENKPGEKDKCEETRRIATSIDWDCELKIRFCDQNMGCGLGPSSAISWFFENVEEGIILEDDCLPHPTFFRYCEELLSYYRDEPKIMHISGDNFLYGKKRGKASYYFSQYTHNWGWATWKRAWQYFDFNLIPEESRRHIWDKQWRLSVEKMGGLAVAPNVNLVSNIGTASIDSTHPNKGNPKYSNLPTAPMVFPIKHPDKIKVMDHFTDYSILVQNETLGSMIDYHFMKWIRSDQGNLRMKIFGILKGSILHRSWLYLVKLNDKIHRSQDN